MAQTLKGKYLTSLIIFPIVYAVLMLGARLLRDTGIFPKEIWTPDYVFIMLFIPLLYYLLLFQLITRHFSRTTAYVVGFYLSLIAPMTAMTQTGGYGSPHVLALLILGFLAATLGPWMAGGVIGLHLLGYVMTLIGATTHAHAEYAAIAISAYIAAALAGWFVFRHHYVQESPDIERINRALRDEQIRSETLLASFADGLLIIDSRGVVQVANTAAASLLNIHVNQLTDMNYLKLFEKVCPPSHNPHYEELYTLFVKLSQLEKPININQLTVVSEENIATDISCSIVPVNDVDNKTAAYLLVMHDISHFTELQKIKDDFVSTASHELRTPLSIISGYTDLLLRPNTGELNEKQRQYIERTKDTTHRLRLLINDMLDLSRIDSGKFVNNPEAIPLQPFIKQVVDDFKTVADNKQQILSYKTDKVVVYVDRQKLIEVLVNLVSNAVKYSPEHSHVTIMGSKSESEVRIDVYDDGPDIPKELQAAIFDKFSRLKTTNVESVEGTGLGLAIAKSLVESWGGTIKLESDGKKGSCFSFTIPIYNDKAKEVTI